MSENANQYSSNVASSESETIELRCAGTANVHCHSTAAILSSMASEFDTFEFAIVTYLAGSLFFRSAAHEARQMQKRVGPPFQ